MVFLIVILYMNDGRFKKNQIPWIKGKKHSLKTRFKMRDAKKRYYENGGISPNKGKKLGQLSDKQKQKLREASIKAGCKPPNHKGLKRSMETRIKISKAKRGSKSHFWKGGTTNKNKIIRESVEYKLWREAVFKRDNYTCRICEGGGGILHPHHIKSFAFFPELRFAIDNGITFCKDCHKKIHKHKF